MHNYTKLVEKRKEYKYSANICFDLRNEARLAGFIPNITTTDILREYLAGIINGKTDIHSRILYGSYGTGKSHLLTVLSAILGHINTDGEGYKSLLSMLSIYDSNLASDIDEFVCNSKPYFVVPIYSDYSDFGQCITFSLKKELDRAGIEVTFRGFFEEALQLLEKWESGEESLERLTEECHKIGVTPLKLKKGLQQYNAKYQNMFHQIYGGMTYGASFNSTGGNLIDNLTAANEATKDSFRGIVYVFDEFGRYVEDYGENIKVKMIQDMAEFCDHSDFDNHIILVSHKQLSMYTDNMKKSVSDEWKKVEGRFKPTSINIKYDQCLSLIKHIIPKSVQWEKFAKKYSKQLEGLYNQALDFRGFLLPPETGGNPFEDGFPLHPIALYALDRLSKKVAQNERTFFTYLAGDDDNSLFEQLALLDDDEFHFIGLDALYDYFEINISAFKTDEAYEIYKKLQIAINKLGFSITELEKRVLKTIAVIFIINDTEVLAADRETLANVIDSDRNEIYGAIDALEKKKVIKYMRQYGYYDFFDSSIFDLEEMIEKELAGITDDMVVNSLNEVFSEFAVYPYRYNEKYHMHRVFIPVFAHKNDISKKAFRNTFPDYYDGIILFVLDNNAEINEYLNMKDVPSRTILFVNSESKDLENEVRRYIAVKYYYTKKEALAKDDPTVIKELSLYLTEQEAIVSEYIRKWRSFATQGVFLIRGGEEIFASSESELTDIISDLMDSSFGKTMVINNDLLNKNILTGAIKQARKKALGYIMNNADIYNECTPLSPEYNILRSTLSKNGIDNKLPEDMLNHFEDGSRTSTEAYDAICNLLLEYESEQIPLQNVYNLLKSEPYGLRDGYIPILLAYALKKYENVSLYFHGNEHMYTEDELVKALETPEDYSLFACNWSEEQRTYIANLTETFIAYIPSEDNLNKLSRLFRAINRHYSHISKSARTTEKYISDEAKKYRQILSISYNDYNEFFFMVLPQINADLQELAIQIRNIKQELESVDDKQYNQVLKITKQIFRVNDSDKLLEIIERLYEDNWKAKSTKVFDYTTNSVLDLASRATEFSEEQFVKELGKIITGFEMSYWSDSKIREFEENLRESVSKLNSYKTVEGLRDGEMKITIQSGSDTPVSSQFSQAELSTAGQMLLNKIEANMANFGESISYEEKISIMTKVLKNIIS